MAATSTRHQQSTKVHRNNPRDSSWSTRIHLPSQLKRLSATPHRHRPAEHPGDYREASQSTHEALPAQYREGSDSTHHAYLAPYQDTRSSDGPHHVPAAGYRDLYNSSWGAPRHELPGNYRSISTSSSTTRHQQPAPSGNHVNRSSTMASGAHHRTITNVEYVPTTPNRHAERAGTFELDDTPTPEISHPRPRPASVTSSSAISSISSLRTSQARALHPIKEMSFDEARCQLRMLQSRLKNLESPYVVNKFGPPARNELKKFEKAAASLARDIDFLVGRNDMPMRNGMTVADALKGEVEEFWDGVLERLVRQKRGGEL